MVKNTPLKYLQNHGRKGIPKTIEHNLKVSLAKRGVSNPSVSGSRHPLWNGGNSKLRKTIKTNDYINWTNGVKRRDGYTCQQCFKVKSITVKIQAHHIFPLAAFPFLSLSLANGISLCIECHRFEHRVLKIGLSN